MDRIYNQLINYHVQHYNKMVFLSGPRQVGKTTITKKLNTANYTQQYLNWDNVVHRAQIMNLVEDFSSKPAILGSKELLILDEIHKMPDWKNYIKGFVDSFNDRCNLILTGSAKLNIYRKGGDSLMGRYFNYTTFPITVGEYLNNYNSNDLYHPPNKIDDTTYETLFKFGGFPEPFLNQTEQFHNQWIYSRHEQLVREDIRNIENIKAIDQLELLAFLLTQQIGSGVKYNNLASKVKVSNNTITHWIDLLSNFYYCFAIKPWSQNIARSLLKEPKIYLWDWSAIDNPGARFENFIAVHLLKAITFWNETGLGKFGLYYIRDKDHKEVDFVITRENKPWLLVEAKLSNNGSISKHMYEFGKITQAPHILQVVHNIDYVDESCFKSNTPTIVPAKTFLSQLI